MAQPLVSIGVPTRNGATYLAEILESLSAQDHPELEILVADNASTDATPEIIAAAAARDPRIRGLRMRVDIGQRENFNRVFQASRGEFFMWASDHDLRQPDFVSQLLAAMEGAPELALAYPRFEVLGETLEPLAVAEGIDTRGLDRVRRVWNVIRRNRTGMMIYGLFRAAMLERTELLWRSPGAYRLLMTQLSVHGAVAEVPGCVLSIRPLRQESAVEAEHRRTRPEFGFGDPADPWASRMPGLRMVMAQMECIRGADMPREEKRQLLAVLMRQSGQAFPMLAAEVERLGQLRGDLDRQLGRDAFAQARAARLMGYATLAVLLFPADAGAAAMRQVLAARFADTSLGLPPAQAAAGSG